MASSRKAEAARWFHQATFDLKAARWNADGGFHDTACFLAQQVGDKGLKSLLYYLGARRAALLPGEDFIEAGLRDLALHRESLAALLVSIGAPRSVRLGFVVPFCFPHPEHRLYRRLQAQDPNTAHGRYNALVRRLVSFERAAACAS